jgi:hypothetical protein
VGIGEFQGEEPLAGALFQVLEHALVPGVVGDGDEKFRGGMQDLSLLFDREDPPVVGQGMDDHGRILSRLDDLVEVAEAPGPHRRGEGAVHPDRFPAAHVVAANQI